MSRRKKNRNWLKDRKITIDYLWIIAGLIASIVLSSMATWRIAHYKSEIEKEEEIAVESALTNHNYDFTHLKWNDHIVSYDDERYSSVFGIDVSAHQKNIDWAKVKAAGVEFAFIRVGYRGYEYGYVNKDEYFNTNIEQALANGIKVGVYFYSQAISLEEAREEADFVLAQIEPYRNQISLPVVFDMEDSDGTYISRISVLKQEEKTKIAVTWMHRIRNAGYEPMYYGSTDLLGGLFFLEFLQEFPCWLAEYATKPRYPYHFQIWQYSGSGSLDGIEGPVDLDVLFLPKGEEIWGF